MASSDEVFPGSDHCEICGALLGEEVVIQEFADGSLARLCPECAAGADLGDRAEIPAPPASAAESIWPDERDPADAVPATEYDPLEKTRELLMPVTDLIALQGDMQAALERLAASLERFAAEMITDSQNKTAVESRLQMLERELEKTRTKLSETEFLITAAAPSPALSTGATAGLPASEPPDAAAPAPLPVVAPPAGAPDAPPDAAVPTATPDVTPPTAAPEVAESVASEEQFVWPDLPESVEAEDSFLEPTSDEATVPFVAPETAETAPASDSPAVPSNTPPATPAPPAPPAAAAPEAAEADARQSHLPTFRIDEVQAVQRYYNESQFTNRVREVRRSLGRPKANLTRLPGENPRAIVTIAWDIVWYQYLVDLRRDLPGGVERISLHREGMDLDELASYFKEKNAVVNDDGRLDASELEVKLLSDPEALITEMTPDELHSLEDATEEIWDQRISPEFKWDD